MHLQPDLAHVHRAYFRRLGKTVGAHRAANVAEDGLHAFVINAQHRQPVKRQIVQEADKALLQVVKAAAVVFEVVGVNVGDDRHHRLQMEEGGVGFVRFRHQILPVAEAGVAACGGEHAADDKGRVESGIGENRGNQAGSGGLAVGSGDGDAEAEAHQLRQHLGAADDRNAQLARAQHFRVFRVNCRRGDDDRGVLDVFRRVAEKQRRALGGEALGIGGRF